MKMILAATRPGEQLYFIIDPPTRRPPSGILIRDNQEQLVDFWSYVTRQVDMPPVRGFPLLEALWGDTDGDWGEIYVNRSKPIPKKLVDASAPLIFDAPKAIASQLSRD